MANVAVRKVDYGQGVMGVASIAGGAIVGTIAQKKISFLSTTLGKLLIIAIGVLIFAKAKSDTVRNLGGGIAVSGAIGFVNQIAGSVNGVEGLFGLGEVGQVVQGPDGMVYMVNGVGEYEPISGVGNFDMYGNPVYGVGAYDMYGYPMMGVEGQEDALTGVGYYDPYGQPIYGVGEEVSI